MADPRNTADRPLEVLYLTTRDVANPRTGADNRAKYLYEGLDRAFPTDLVHFTRGERPGTDAGGVSVPYPPSELLAMVSIRYLGAVIRAVRGRDYDVVVVSGIGAVTYGLVATVLSQAPFVFDDHNVEFELARETSRPRYIVVRLLERLACRTAALLVVPTEAVAAALAPWARGNVEIVTNGFDAESFTPDGPVAGFTGRTLLFFGNFAYEPNREAFRFLVKELCPRLEDLDIDATVRVAGPGSEALEVPPRLFDSVDLLGFVDDLPATIRGADVVVVPLTAGSGSRLKIIESLACGTPVVSTPIGAEGWPSDWTNLHLADLDRFVEVALAAIEDPEFYPAEHDQYSQYSWRAQSDRLVEAVATVAATAS